MEITASNEQGRVPVRVLHITGDVDTSSFEQLQKQAREEIDAGARYLVLDLEKVHYVSSYGIRAISQIFSWLRQAAGDEGDKSAQGASVGTYFSPNLKLAGASPMVNKVLTDTGLDLYMQICDNVEQAVAAF